MVALILGSNLCIASQTDNVERAAEILPLRIKIKVTARDIALAEKFNDEYEKKIVNFTDRSLTELQLEEFQLLQKRIMRLHGYATMYMDELQAASVLAKNDNGDGPKIQKILVDYTRSQSRFKGNLQKFLRLYHSIKNESDKNNKA